MGANGVAWATPIADFGAMLASIALFIPFWRQLRRSTEQTGEKMPQEA